MSAGLVAVDVCGAGWAGGAVLVRLSMSAGLVAVAKGVGKTILLGRSGFLENSRGQCPKNKGVPYRSFG